MPIQQHPIPQDVAGYRFRLIGEMTLKQFLWLASGIIGALIFYSSPLPFFFKYPLAGVALIIGAGTAFIPIQGRSMDKWIVAFIRSIYSPTQYVWQKSPAENITITSAAPKPAITPPATPLPITQPIPVTSSPLPKPAAVPTPPVQAPIQVTQPTSSQPSIQAPVPETKPIVQPHTPTQPPKEAVIDTRLPIPITPTTPNTLVGMTLTPDGKILENTLVEIKFQGNTIRATKSNQLGQFLFAKPLENNLYQIVTEKANFSFDTYTVNLTGQIVKPLKLQAKAPNQA